MTHTVISRSMKPRELRSAEPANRPVGTNARPVGPDLVIVYLDTAKLRPAARKLHKPNPKKLAKLAANITRFGILRPILATADGEIVDGEMIVEACKKLRIDRVPALVVDGFSDAEVRTIRLAMNKLPEGRAWNEKELAQELAELLEIDATLIEFTGFEMAEVDRYLSDLAGASDDDAPDEKNGPVVSRLGDLWLFAGKHKLFCGNARDRASYQALLGPEAVQMVLTDPPYGCEIKDYASSTHDDFVEGSGMNESQSVVFFEAFLTPMSAHLGSGTMVFTFIDAPGLYPLQQAIRRAGFNQKALVVWDKGVGGMGSLYRQQAEFVLVSKWGSAHHINNVRLGKHGRNRTTVWSVPGLAQAGSDRKRALELHPTVKPVALLMDAILDTSALGGIILDPFTGSGSTLIAAHRTQRLGRGIELDPKYVDVAVARMEKITGKPAIHAETGLTFAAMADRRAAESQNLRPVALPARS